MTEWNELFSQKRLYFLEFSINANTGELTVMPLDATFDRSKEALVHATIAALAEVFRHFGLELRDVVDEHIPRAYPLDKLVRIQANLTTIDTVMSLSNVLTPETIKSLQEAAGPTCTTTARATLKRVYYPKHQMYVNTVVTLKPCKKAAPFRKYEHGHGTCAAPKQLPNGNYMFALSNPFDHSAELAAHEEAELAAWHIGARLEEFLAPF